MRVEQRTNQKGQEDNFKFLTSKNHFQMDIEVAQKNMRDAYLGGGSGVLVSGLVWMTAGTFAIYGSKQMSFLVFFIAGMFIHPLGLLVDKLFKRSGKHLKENPLGPLAMESTVILFIGLFLVYALFQTFPNWLFPVMLLMIGVRYLIFQTIFGMKIYWILGISLIIAGGIGLVSNLPFYSFGMIGGLIELIFSILIIQKNKKDFKLGPV